MIFHSYVKLPEGKPPFSYGFPVVFLRLSYGFPISRHISRGARAPGLDRSLHWNDLALLMKDGAGTKAMKIGEESMNTPWHNQWIYYIDIIKEKMETSITPFSHVKGVWNMSWTLMISMDFVRDPGIRRWHHNTQGKIKANWDEIYEYIYVFWCFFFLSVFILCILCVCVCM